MSLRLASVPGYDLILKFQRQSSSRGAAVRHLVRDVALGTEGYVEERHTVVDPVTAGQVAGAAKASREDEGRSAARTGSPTTTGARGTATPGPTSGGRRGREQGKVVGRREVENASGCLQVLNISFE